MYSMRRLPRQTVIGVSLCCDLEMAETRQQRGNAGFIEMWVSCCEHRHEPARLEGGGWRAASPHRWGVVGSCSFGEAEMQPSSPLRLIGRYDAGRVILPGTAGGLGCCGGAVGREAEKGIRASDLSGSSRLVRVCVKRDERGETVVVDGRADCCCLLEECFGFGCCERGEREEASPIAASPTPLFIHTTGQLFRHRQSSTHRREATRQPRQWGLLWIWPDRASELGNEN